MKKALLGVAVLFFLGAVPASAEVIVSAMGGKCLDVEGGSTRNGTRIIAYACTGSANQNFKFNSDGTLRWGGKCVDASGGLGNNGDGIVLWDCNGGPNQKWRFMGDIIVATIGAKGDRCLVMEGGGGSWWNGVGNVIPWGMFNQRTVVWDCNGSANSKWVLGKFVRGTSSGYAKQGQGFPQSMRVPSGASLIGVDGGSIVAAGAGNIVAAGAGN